MNMREKLQQAILAQVPQGYGMTKAEAYVYADAVLDALMEPTEGMLEAAAEIDGLDALPEWQAMIQAAKEGK